MRTTSKGATHIQFEHHPSMDLEHQESKHNDSWTMELQGEDHLFGYRHDPSLVTLFSELYSTTGLVPEDGFNIPVPANLPNIPSAKAQQLGNIFGDTTVYIGEDDYDYAKMENSNQSPEVILSLIRGYDIAGEASQAPSIQPHHISSYTDVKDEEAIRRRRRTLKEERLMQKSI